MDSFFGEHLCTLFFSVGLATLFLSSILVRYLFVSVFCIVSVVFKKLSCLLLRIASSEGLGVPYGFDLMWTSVAEELLLFL